MFDIFYTGTKPNLFAHEQECDTIEQAQQLSRTRYFWWVNYLTDYTGWDFLWEPSPWQSHQRHAWPSQWQKDSETYLVPKSGSPDTNYHKDVVLTRQPSTNNWHIPLGCDTTSFDFSWHPDPTDPELAYQFGTQHQRTGGPVYAKNLAADVKYVDQITIRTRPQASRVYVIDHMDGNVEAVTKQAVWADDLANTTVVRYFDNYLDTLKRIARSAEEEFVWIISSVCDYATFDFSWHPDKFQGTMLHVFASDGMKFGDTFFMHVPSFLARADQFKLLEWYDLNFVGQSVPRRALSVIEHLWDTQVQAVQHTNFPGPVVVFSVGGYQVDHVPPVNLWRSETKAIIPLSLGAGLCVVPRIAAPYVKRQVYDYPLIDKSQRHMYADELLDIVFIDNGEPNADTNYEYLKWAAERAHNVCIHRSIGVNGRVAAYQAAAKLSTTPWFFAVFAKLEVSSRFDWAWQPDRLQEPKHYIFHAYNPVNGLEYGHQAMIAYNKELVLNNPGVGLDFTLDSAHEVVPIISGTAYYNNTPWMAWRTAFRESIKLQCSADVESKYRLDKWRTVDLGQLNGDYSIMGANDAVEYYEAVAGDFAELRKSYDWGWLASYALLKRNLVTN